MPEKKVCTICLREGHRASNCPSQKRRPFRLDLVADQPAQQGGQPKSQASSGEPPLDLASHRSVGTV